jgi:hypothetical protein
VQPHVDENRRLEQLHELVDLHEKAHGGVYVCSAFHKEIV